MPVEKRKMPLEQSPPSSVIIVNLIRMQNTVFNWEDPGYRAILKLDGRFVTTYFRESVEYTNTSPAMIEYVKSPIDIDGTVFCSINWTSVGRIQASHGTNRIVRTSKVMF